MKLIAGDIGGTKTILALFTSEDGPEKPLYEDTRPSGSYGSLEAVVREFTDRHGVTDVDRAVFGVAGPVMGERARITNLSWEIDASRLRKEFGLRRVKLINDLQAVAYGIALLRDEDLFTLNRGVADSTGPKAVIAAGTGLGEAYLTWDGRHYIAHASEGGHTEFGPSNALELELLKYLMERFDHVSYERVCSGTGIPNIYSFLKDTGIHDEPGWFAERLAGARHDRADCKRRSGRGGILRDLQADRPHVPLHPRGRGRQSGAEFSRGRRRVRGRGHTLQTDIDH